MQDFYQPTLQTLNPQAYVHVKHTHNNMAHIIISYVDASRK